MIKSAMVEKIQFDRDAITAALKRMGELASREGYLLELSVFGGAALALAYNLRVGTGDVDAVSADAALMRRLAAGVAKENGWPEDWLNDGVKGFLSADGKLQTSLEAEGIRVSVPAPDYLIAMKALAMRIDAADPKDRMDLKRLIALQGYTTAAQVIEVVADHYPASRIPPRTVFGIEELLDELRSEREKEP